MKLIIGLGNPGLKYKKTRHNLGFFLVEKFMHYFLEKNFRFFDFEFDKKTNALISAGQISGEKILLVMPQTYMNKSGFSVSKLVQFYKLNPSRDILLIYDDIDLPLGKIKTSGESAAGHKGMESVINALSTKKISRLRLGILGKPKSEIRDVAKYVLEEFEPEEEKIIKEKIAPEAISLVEEFLKK